jgi:5-methylcytosine-specific restriction endonuclease McrA
MRVLVLNASYEFLGFCDAPSAICSVYTGKATVEEEYETVWHSATSSMRVPAVIRLKKFVKVAYDRITYVSYTKRNVHLRDEYTCQYCGVKCLPNKIGIDHVLPESRGGLTSWTNTVSCCHPCNSEKDNRTPQEAGMRLLRTPGKPHGFREIIRIKLGEVSDLWSKYL